MIVDCRFAPTKCRLGSIICTKDGKMISNACGIFHQLCIWVLDNRASSECAKLNTLHYIKHSNNSQLGTEEYT